MSTDAQKPNILAAKLRRIREDFSLMHAEMAMGLVDRGATQIDAEMIAEIEAEQREATPETLAAYAAYSGIPVSSFTDDAILPFVRPLH